MSILTSTYRAADLQANGKARHPAALNFEDCFSYALAEATGSAVLFKGKDFRETDIQMAS